jgi:hypothetical protein
LEDFILEVFFMVGNQLLGDTKVIDNVVKKEQSGFLSLVSVGLHGSVCRYFSQD